MGKAVWVWGKEGNMQKLVIQGAFHQAHNAFSRLELHRHHSISIENLTPD